ncbi:OmpA family protein [Methylocaldum szegediense]|uniref:OmpA family protein n=1 Tax=Methylocaldum szegediense TaxID=73780 RepID=UPI0003F7D255|nr:OmpA family protein [Methylocaldum szegediense]
MKMPLGISFLFLAAAAFISGTAQAEKTDLAGSADHALVGRYEGSVITFYETKSYEELKLPFKALERGQKDKPEAWQIDVSGKLTSIRYEGPADRSILEVMRNYEAALNAKGFTIRFFCRGAKECAPAGSTGTFWEVGNGQIGMPTTWDTTVYLLAERDGPEGRVTVGMLGVETKATKSRPLTPHVAVTVVESKPMEADKIAVVKSSEMQQALERDGRIAIYGIYFDFDKAEIKPESEPQIVQLAALLKENPKLKVLIVGHTDGKGAFDYNLSLSQRRAQAVADTLVSAHGIARDRLTPAGAGMLAPVASNKTEEGRAKNRRVEIVEHYSGG